jgi:transposase
MVRAPTPEDEDRRRICRERKVLIMERVQHVNRINPHSPDEVIIWGESSAIQL